MLSRGLEMVRSTDARLIDLHYEMPPPHIAEALRLDPAENVQAITRLRFSAGVTFCCFVTRVPGRLAKLLPEKSLETERVIGLFDRAGIVASSATQSISATLAGPVMASHLGVAVGSVLLTLSRITFDADGRGIMHLEGYHRPDLFSFQMDIVRQLPAARASGVRAGKPSTRASSERNPGASKREH